MPSGKGENAYFRVETATTATGKCEKRRENHGYEVTFAVCVSPFSFLVSRKRDTKSLDCF